jgi:hypothetical protein
VGERVEHVPRHQEGGAFEREALELVEQLGDDERQQEGRQLPLEKLAHGQAVEETVHWPPPKTWVEHSNKASVDGPAAPCNLWFEWKRRS